MLICLYFLIFTTVSKPYYQVIMTYKNILSAFFIASTALFSCQDSTIIREKEALIPISFEKVALQDQFWLPRLKTQKQTLVPFSLEKTETAVENLRRTAAYLKNGTKEQLLPLARYVASDLFNGRCGLFVDS